MMLAAATEAFSATGAHLVSQQLLVPTEVELMTNTDSSDWFRMMLRVLSVLVLLASATRYIFSHKCIMQRESLGVKEAKPPSPRGSPKKKKSVTEDSFDSEDDGLSTAAGSTATSDDELDDSPSYSRTVMMNYRAYCMASPPDITVSTSITKLQGLTVKDKRLLKSARSNTSEARESYDDRRWECLRGSRGIHTQVKTMEMPPGLEQPEASSDLFVSCSAPMAAGPIIAVSVNASPSDDGRPWRTKAKTSSPTSLSSPLLNPISGGLRPQKKL